VKKETDNLRTWIEIDKKAIKKNYQIFRPIISKNCMFMSVVKSNAYGHGLVPFSREVERLGVDWLGVDSVVEGITLRNNSVKIPILVLGYTLASRLKEAIKNDISISVSNFQTLKEILKNTTRGKVKIHIKTDTGMHRQGFLESDIPKLIKILKISKKKIVVEGLYTHFATAKNPPFFSIYKKPAF